jgi:hypothetical protein
MSLICWSNNKLEYIHPLLKTDTALNINTYTNEGWGLSALAFITLEVNILSLYKTISGNMNIIEFGSGTSSQFLIDLKYKYDLDIHIDSFDNSAEYAFKSDKDHLCFNLYITDLVECGDVDLKYMFDNKIYNKDKMCIKKTEPTTRQRNCFYNIDEIMLQDYYDIVVIDGPNGNGRSIGFLHLINKLKKGSLVFIDDFTHYGFVDDMNKIFDTKLIYSHNSRTNIAQWFKGGQFCVYMIL